MHRGRKKRSIRLIHLDQERTERNFPPNSRSKIQHDAC